MSDQHHPGRAPRPGARPGPARDPLRIAVVVAAVGFAIMIAVELLIYEKGILRALWVSAASALVLFAVALLALRAGARAAASADRPDRA